MNKRQVIILWAIAIGLGASVTAVKISQNKAIKTSTERKSGETLFNSFPATETASVVIEGPSSTVTLTKKDGKWVVAERGDYPANPNFVNELIRTLSDLKITQAMEAGPSFAPRFGMDDSATKPEEHGLTATFKDAFGKEIAKVGLGKNIESSSAPSGMPPGMGGGAVGRYVRNFADSSGFYAVGEMFPSVSAEAKRWLSDTFINPEKIKSITVNKPGTDEVDWKVSRETEEAEFKLENAKEGELADTTATEPMKSLFSYARFEDVVPADKVAEKQLPETKRTVVLETVEGFTYKLNISAMKQETPAASTATPAAVPPPSDNYLLTVDVTAELPKERKKEEGEKPEDAKTKDEAFTARQKALAEKLEKEKALAGVTFEVSKSTLEPILKDRVALTTKPTPPPAEGADQGSVQQLPGGMIARPPASATTPPIQAVTPPISVPAAGEEEAAGEDEAAEDGVTVEPYDPGAGEESSGEE